jgi:hypothetical protein
MKLIPWVTGFASRELTLETDDLNASIEVTCRDYFFLDVCFNRRVYGFCILTYQFGPKAHDSIHRFTLPREACARADNVFICWTLSQKLPNLRFLLRG